MHFSKNKRKNFCMLSKNESYIFFKVYRDLTSSIHVIDHPWVKFNQYVQQQVNDIKKYEKKTLDRRTNTSKVFNNYY